MINSYNDLVKMIARRDNISINEAYDAIEECRTTIMRLIDEGSGYDEVADILANDLGIEPDYLELIL